MYRLQFLCAENVKTAEYAKTGPASHVMPCLLYTSKRGKMLLDYVSNRQLQENVPGLEKTRFGRGKLNRNAWGEYDTQADKVTIGDSLTGEAFREVVAHETQHGVQEKQDMANGADSRSALAWWLRAYYETVKANPAFKALQTPQERFDYLLSPAKKRFGTSDINMIAFRLYESNYGEQQARNTASRVGMTCLLYTSRCV